MWAKSHLLPFRVTHTHILWTAFICSFCFLFASSTDHLVSSFPSLPPICLFFKVTVLQNFWKFFQKSSKCGVFNKDIQKVLFYVFIYHVVQWLFEFLLRSRRLWSFSDEGRILKWALSIYEIWMTNECVCFFIQANFCRNSFKKSSKFLL
jgi:hypothetical protein